MYGNTFKNYPVREISGHKVHVTAVYYFGCLQGYKVKIDGIKYPEKSGHWYTELNLTKAIHNAFNDLKTVKA